MLGNDDWAVVASQGSVMFPTRGTAAALALLPTSCALAEDPWFTFETHPYEGYGCAHLTDIDGDGHLDMIMSTSPRVWRRNNGSGQFGAPVQMGFDGPADRGIYEDLTGDGRADALMLRDTDGAVQIYRGVGDGSFVTLAVSPVPIAITRIARGDLNGDGVFDIVGFTSGHTMITLLGDGQLGFMPGDPVAIPHEISKAFIFDATGDATPDFIALDTSETHAIHVYAGDGHGHLSYEAASPLSGSAVRVFPVDLDVDGDVDLVTSVDDRLWLYTASGDGAFTAQRLSDEPIVRVLGVIDIDRDGDVDPVAFNQSSVVVFRNNTGLHFDVDRYDHGGPEPLTTHLADITGDGRVDLLAQNKRMRIIPGDGAGGFERGSMSREPAGTTDFSSTADVRCELIDDDDAVDLAWVDVTVEAGLHIELGDANGTFTPYKVFNPGGRIGPWIIGDFWQDERRELLWINEDTNSLYVQYNNDDGLFETRRISNGLVFDHMHVVTDLNGDGRGELIATLPRWYDYALAIVDHVDDYYVHVRLILWDVARPFKVVALDLDADGDKDIIALDGTSLVGLIQHDLDNFERLPDLTGIHDVVELRVRDIDGDGDEDLDLLGRNHIFRWLNPSNATLPPPELVYDGPDDLGLTVDLDGDGRLESLEWIPDGYRIRHIEAPNTSDAHFVLPGSRDALADVDHDGDIDIIGPGYVAWNRAIYECAGDVNGDHVRDMQDLGAILASFGLLPDDPSYNADADLNGDGTIDLNDLGGLLAVFDTPCG
jgi:hypothetical protein